MVMVMVMVVCFTVRKMVVRGKKKRVDGGSADKDGLQIQR
jgi:hypothetical protein